MFKCFTKWMTRIFKSWTQPWNKAQDLEFKEWMYRRGLHIKTD